MNLKLFRYSSGQETTLGLLMRMDTPRPQFMAYTLEDEYRSEKVYGETRIPAGTYRLILRGFGGHHDRYKTRFTFHKGMIEIQGVPGFTDVLIHIGNRDDDTAGCILVGDGSNSNIPEEGSITSSTRAYRRIYPLIADGILRDDESTLEILDEIR